MIEILKVDSLEVNYASIKAVRKINFFVKEKEMISLIGSNGAGKSSTLKSICGLIRNTGKVIFMGEDITNLNSHKLAQRGLILVPEGRGIFGRLTVKENLDMGAFSRNDRKVIKKDLQNVYNFFPRLFERKNQDAGTLSGGEQQMVAIGRALMSKPKLLFLDEPSMGLAPLMVKKIFEVIKNINNLGVTILIVEQNAKLALEISDRALVMSNGQIRLNGPSKKLMLNKEIKKAYFGE